ncbi:MAG TPA: VOC family protein, partial [Tepidiformaceae bacterium]|nr:VOC family protein [Tepidiformaceae bacterium]
MWLRLRQIALVARELAPVEADLKAVLGVEVCYRDPGVERFGLENALFPIGDQFLEVVAPIREETAGGRYLERRGGDGGYMVITQCDSHAPRRKRVEELGVRVVTQFETDDFRNMQLHPKDTGGSFFEIDEQTGPGAHEPDGPWEPAGGHDWKKAQRLDVVSGILAAEVQCDEPAAVAGRWSEIAQIPLARNEAGGMEMPLKDATVRFVPVNDGRGEGLGGIDLRVQDRQRLLSAAKERGCYRSDDMVEICGT